MESPYLHDHDHLQQQQFVGSYSSPTSTQSRHEWNPSINLDESYGSNYTPTISTSLNHQDHSFFQNQWHPNDHNFAFDHNHDLMSTELQLSSASLMFPNTTITTTTRHDHQFSHVFPTTNISPTSDYIFPRLNLKAFDLFTSSYDSEISSSTLHHHPFHGDSPTESSNQISSKGNNGITSTKRPPSKHIESKEPNSHTNTKKTKSSMPRSPCPTMKVRKEKLGDRIAALQKLVAPFGKTDTASVLNEAIGYILFLHDQVQTLTVPYMNSSRNKPCSARKMSAEEGRREELERDLTSRGLSLVSHDFASYSIRSYNGNNI